MREGKQSRLHELDVEYTRQLQVTSNFRFIRPFAIILAHSGDSWFWIAGLALIWLFGTEYWKVRAGWMIAGILITAVLVMALKFVFRRKRPDGTWGNIYRRSDPHSFPSGHAARAALLTCLVVGFGPPFIAVLMLIWAPLVILARVIMGLHYLSDVIAGMVIGIFIGFLLLQFFPHLPFQF